MRSLMKRVRASASTSQIPSCEVSAMARKRASLPRSAASAARRAVTSMLTPTTRAGRPSGPRSARPRTMIQRTSPSGRTTRNSLTNGSATFIRRPRASASARSRSSGCSARSHAP